ncbi:PD-(D/E)XK nuclease superfamily protein [Bhargavaea beijingensis]|uniref:PD-(D/E)XK nuclease superfamily protein n=2 Tax=Bhargavaea beijingensis TaxID=426756 RepID=A0A1G6Y1X2_9BACL|nr:PD-(D/E)XK nuclease family protein [Bhargavaea beijingensis]SDD84399.1 PD-(D/E)XK nuclease superfamily protein [Bhargavaea beijingensis]
MKIRHSNVLCWLMDPAGNHNLGPYFAKKIIAKVFTNPANTEDEDKLSNYDVLEISSHPYHDLTVYKELQTSNRKRIDLLAVSDSHKIVLLIENKYWSGESEGQLEEYIEYTRSVYGGYKIIPVFLTLRDEEPTHEDYLMLGYSDVLAILQQLLETRKEYMNAHIHSFISYYTDILEDQLVENEKLNATGMDLYRNHKEAIDLLYSLRQGPADGDQLLFSTYQRHKETVDFIKSVGDSILKEAFLKFARKQRWPEHLYTAHFRVPHFLEESWFTHYGESDLRKSWWMNRGLIAWFERAGDRLKLRAEVGPLEHELRVRLLLGLAARGLDIKEQAYEESSQYTRIYMDAESPESWEDVSELARVMERLYQKEAFQSLLRLTNEAVVYGEEGVQSRAAEGTPIEQAFRQLLEARDIRHYQIHRRLPNFAESEWTRFPDGYQLAEKYWLGYPLIAWFRSRNSTLRLIIEVGPLPSGKRNHFLSQLEAEGVPVRALSYEEGRRFTRIFSRAVPVGNIEDATELGEAMVRLMDSAEYCEMRGRIRRAIESL